VKTSGGPDSRSSGLRAETITQSAQSKIGETYGPNIGQECQKGQKEVEERVGNSQKQTKETVRKKTSNLLCDDVEIR